MVRPTRRGKMMFAKVNEIVACKYYDLELTPLQAKAHYEAMQAIIQHHEGGYLRGGATSPLPDSGSRVRFFLESHCTEFYEKAMGIYEYPDTEEVP